MSGATDTEITLLARKYALQNALEYDGKGQVGSTLGRLLSERQDLRPRARDLMALVSQELIMPIQCVNMDQNTSEDDRGIDPNAVEEFDRRKMPV